MDARAGGEQRMGAEALGLASLPAPALATILDCLPPAGWAALATTSRGLAAALRDDHVGGWRARCGAPAAAAALVGPRALAAASSSSSSSSSRASTTATGRAPAPATLSTPPPPGHIGKRTALSLARVAEWGAALRHTGEVNTLVALKLHELPQPPPAEPAPAPGAADDDEDDEENGTSVALRLPPSVAVRMPHLSPAERGVVERLEAAMGGLLGSDGDASDAGGGVGGSGAGAAGRRGSMRAPAGPVDDPVAGLARTFRTLLPSATPGWRAAPGPVQADAAEGHLLTILSTGVAQRQRGAPPPMAAVAAAEALADELAAAAGGGVDDDGFDDAGHLASVLAASKVHSPTSARPHARRAAAAKRWLQAVPESSPYRVAVAPLALVPPTHHGTQSHGGGGGSGGSAAAAAFLGSQVGVRTAFGTVRGGAPIPSSLGGLTTPVQHVSVGGGGRVAAVDGGGTLRVHAHDGTRLAAGKVAGVCSGSGSGGGGGGGVGRCCASVCSLDYHAPSSAVVTGHPDGSAVVTVFSGGQAVRAATALRFDDALLAAAVGATGLGGSGSGVAPPPLPSRRALASQGMRGHTSACWMDHGTQLLVGRSLRAGPLLPMQCGTLSLHSPETGELVRLLQPPTAGGGSSGSGRGGVSSADAYGDGTGLGSCPTVVKAVSPTTALVGYANGLLRLWDVRSPKPAITARLAGDPRRVVAPSSLLAPPPPGRVRPFHLPGDTRAVADAGAPIQHLACDATYAGSGGGSSGGGGSGLPLVYEARKGGAYGGGDGRYGWAASSPFIRAWDLRSSSGTPVHVVDLGPHSLRRVAGLHADGSRLLVAHTHVWCPSSEAASAGAQAAADGADWRPPQFHWNAADRGRGGGGGGGGAAGDDGAAPVAPLPPADPAAATDSLPHHLAESDVYTGLVPAYAWPAVGGSAPPTTIGGGDDGGGGGGAPGALFWRGGARGGSAGRRPPSPPAPIDVYGEPVTTTMGTAEAGWERDDVSDTGSDNDGDGAHSRRRFAPLVPVGGSDMSGLSVWHPGTLSLCAYVPLASAGCLAADGVTVAVGTDAGVLTWTTTTSGGSAGAPSGGGGGGGQRSAPGTPSASPHLGGMSGSGLSPSSPKVGGRGAGELLEPAGGGGGIGGGGRHWLRQRPGDKQYRDMNARQRKGGGGSSGGGAGGSGGGGGVGDGDGATAAAGADDGGGARRHGRRSHHNHLQRHHRTPPTGGAAASSSYGKPRPRYDPRDEAQTDAAREAAAAAAAAGGRGSARRVSTASIGSRRSRSSGVSDASGGDDSDDWSSDEEGGAGAAAAASTAAGGSGEGHGGGVGGD
jgi:hypothetical protein